MCKEGVGRVLIMALLTFLIKLIVLEIYGQIVICRWNFTPKSGPTVLSSFVPAHFEQFSVSSMQDLLHRVNLH